MGSVGIGYDIHRLVSGRPLILGGVQVCSDVGFATPSDGDVLCHALIDPLAGALVEGDLGDHSPADEDSAAQDARSLDSLAAMREALREAGAARPAGRVRAVEGGVVPPGPVRRRRRPASGRVRNQDGVVDHARRLGQVLDSSSSSSSKDMRMLSKSLARVAASRQPTPAAEAAGLLGGGDDPAGCREVRPDRARSRQEMQGGEREPAVVKGQEGGSGARVASRHREHRFPGRCRPVSVRFDEEEFAAIELAAGRAGLTPTGYLGAVALAAARGTVPPAPSSTQQALAELMQARAQVRRFGGNVNQAVAQLNSTGEAPEWLGAAVELTARAVRRVDDAAEALMRGRG